jgi:hypothetical protein
MLPITLFEFGHNNEWVTISAHIAANLAPLMKVGKLAEGAGKAIGICEKEKSAAGTVKQLKKKSPKGKDRLYLRASAIKDLGMRKEFMGNLPDKSIHF